MNATTGLSISKSGFEGYFRPKNAFQCTSRETRTYIVVISFYVEPQNTYLECCLCAFKAVWTGKKISEVIWISVLFVLPQKQSKLRFLVLGVITT